jgi:hypothetical protein
MQIRPLVELEEVQPHKVIEVGLEELVIGQVEAIIEFGELEYHLDNLRLASAAQAAVILSSENAFNALIDHLWTDRVFCRIPLRLEIWMLLWHYYDCFVVLHFPALGSLHDGALDVSPNVRGVVPI